MDRKLLAVLLLVSTLCVPHPVCGWWIKKKSWSVSATGKVTCDGKPVPFVSVQLMDNDVFYDDKMGSTTTDSQGNFKVSGTGRDGYNGKPDPFIKVKYLYDGDLGRLDVTGSWFTRSDKSSVKSYSDKIDFGTLDFNNINCRSYIKFYEALKDFKTRTGFTPPYKTLEVRTHSWIHLGKPHATTNVIRIPNSWDTISKTVAMHEFAQTIRNSYDGGLIHFSIDIFKYGYGKTHGCDKKTNEGRAFSEGWAAYWAGECTDEYKLPTDYSYEGNVAHALRALEKKCHKKNGEGNLVKVLKNNRNAIHSFHEFNKQHEKIYKCKL